MGRLSLYLAPAFAALVAGQVAQQTAVIADLDPPEPGCNGCYVVADVAGVVFGDVLTQTATRLVNVGVRPNGTSTVTEVTTITPSSLIGQGQVTIDPSGNPGPAPIQFNDLDSVITISGAVLTSPTAYQVFTAYTITDFQSQDGSCVTIPGSRSGLETASSYIVGDEDPEAAISSAELAFIDGLGITCSPAGARVNSIVQSMVEVTTADITASGPIRISAIAPGPTASTTDVASSTVTETSTVTFNGSLAIPTAGVTYTPIVGAGATAAPVLGGFAALAMGIVAVWL